MSCTLSFREVGNEGFLVPVPVCVFVDMRVRFLRVCFFLLGCASLYGVCGCASLYVVRMPIEEAKELLKDFPSPSRAPRSKH